MLRLNLHVGPVRTKINSTKSMNNSEMITQKTSNLHVYSLDDIESKIIKEDKRESNICYTEKIESKGVIVNACYYDESKSKIIHISLNTV